MYRANTDVTNSTATLDLNKWDNIVGSGIEQWQPSTDYRVRNVVVNNNQIYICTTAHTSDSTAFNTDIANWGLLDTKWKSENWSANTLYTANEVVLYDNRLFRCVSTHTSAADFATDANYWLAIGSRLEVWKQNVHYKVEDIIINNHKLYRCIIEHTSTNTFDSTKWDEISPTKLDDWQASTDYAIGDYVLNNNKIYKCTTAHTSTSDFDISKWVEISSYDIDLWQPSTEYIVGNLALYDNRIYRCNTAHISDSTSFGVDIANWDEIGSSGIDSWEQNKLYSADNIVIYNNKIYKCITGHTSSTTFDPTKWVEVSSSDIDAWSVSTAYVVGDFVYRNNQLYRCITAHTSDSSDFDVDIAKWELLDTKWKAENWVASKLYTANEVVLYDNRLFKCISTHISAVDFATDGSYWQALSSKLEPWKTTTYYTVGDTVINNNKLYKCIVAHTSDSTSMLTDASNWEIVGSSGIDTWKSNEDYTTSSVVIYNNKIYKCNTAHTSGSTFDPTKWDEISSADIDLWQVSTAYKVGNLVINNNQIYRCKTAHTSSSTFNSDISNWDILDTKWQAKDWTTNTYYFSGEIILYDNMLYKCITAHTSLGTFELDKADWEPLSANIRQWVSRTTYKVGDTVLFGNELYKCITANNDAIFRKDRWTPISKCNIEIWNGAPDTNILALLHMDNGNDLGYNEYGDDFAISNDPAMSSGRFGLGINLASRRGRVSSSQYDFNNGETYTIEFWMLASDAGFTENAHVVIGNIGEVITFRMYQGLRIFYGTPYAFIPTNFIGGAWNHMAFVISPTECTTFINGKLESTSTRSDSSPIYLTIGDRHNQSDFGSFGIDELLITKREKYTVDFDVPTEPFQNPNFVGYKKDDLVVYNNKIYRALVDNNDVQFDKSKWVEVSSANTPLWENNIYYGLGDIVIYDDQTYRCTTAHTSNTFLGDIANWESLDTNWLVNDWVANKLYLENQVVSYDDGLWKCLVTHESASGDSPADAVLYESSTNVIDVNDTTTIPYSETIDLGSVKKVTDFTYNEVTTDMSFTYTIETSEDNVTFIPWAGIKTNARYVKLTVDTISIVSGATSPNAYLDSFTVIGESDKWEKISSGGADIELARTSDIDEMFI